MKMALTEQYVLQLLKENSSLSIYYWSAENSRLPIIHYIPYLQYSDKKQSSQTCEPQPCELLIVYCKSGTEPSQGVWCLHAKLEF